MSMLRKGYLDKNKLEPEGAKIIYIDPWRSRRTSRFLKLKEIRECCCCCYSCRYSVRRKIIKKQSSAVQTYDTEGSE